MTFYDQPRDLRAACRSGAYDGPTSGHAQGFVQANMVILPAADAEEFKQFCARNPKPCPVLEILDPGDPEPKNSAPGADVRMRTLQSGTAALAKTHPRAHCIDQIECFMEAVDDTVTPKLDGRRAHKEPGLTPMQKAWARDGAVWLEEFLPASLCDRYKHFWYKHSPGPGGWGHPTPYVEHEQIRDIAMYPPVMDAMQELIGGEMVLHLTLTGFKSTTRSWHQDDYLNAPCVNSWRSVDRA